jgi:hypothetical protein
MKREAEPEFSPTYTSVPTTPEFFAERQKAACDAKKSKSEECESKPEEWAEIEKARQQTTNVPRQTETTFKG